MLTDNIAEVVEPLRIKKTSTTPLIELDPSTCWCEIEGNSLSATTNLFYEPVVRWVQDYRGNDDQVLTFNFKLTNYNTDTSRVLLKVLCELEKISKRGSRVKVNWYFNEWDKEIQEAGQIFSEWVNIPFELKRNEIEIN